MFVINTKNKVLLLETQDPGRIRAAIPNATPFVYKGKQVLVIPHKVPECRVLRGLGYNVPSPILYHYNWPNNQGYSPYHAQSMTADFLTMNPDSFVLNEIGTGKTLAASWAADYLMSQGMMGRCLIISPLSTLNRVWGDAFWTDFPHRNFEVLVGTRQKRLSLLSKDADFYIINPEGAKTIHEELAHRPDITHIIVDEIAGYRKATTDKYKVLQWLRFGEVKGFPKGPLRNIWGLTGTPTPNNPTDAWAQCRLVNPRNVPTYFKQFRLDTMYQQTEFLWLPKVDAMDKVYRAMQPGIRFIRDECYDLPPEIYEDREISFSKEQTAAYKEMAKTFTTEFETGEIVAANEGVKMSKLVQIAAGVVYDTDGGAHFLPCKDRMKVLYESIMQSGSKTIVFVPYKIMTNMVEEELQRKGLTTARVDGSVSSSARDKIFSAFQNSPDPRVLIAHPKCMSHGLTLTEASTIVWYAPYADSDVYTQANGRISRAGQKLTQVYIHLQGSEIERRIYRKLRDKQSLQGTLLEMFEQKVI